MGNPVETPCWYSEYVRKDACERFIRLTQLIVVADSDTPEKTLYLVDGSSYLFRAYHAMGDLRNSEGVPTGAAFNFINMLNRLLEEDQPEHIAVVFDPEGSSFRKEMFEPYKENRDETPEDLVEQIPYVFNVLDAMGVPRLSVEDYEADDVIATLTRKGREDEFEVVLVSSDKDLTQLIDDHVIMYDTMRDRTMDEDYVRERYDVREPEQMIDYLAMVGDSSDNIPGLSGIGKKSAAKLLDRFDSMEEALENPEDIESTRIRNAIKEVEEDANLFKDLIRLRTDAPVDLEPDELTRDSPDRDRLREIFRELEFHQLLEDLPGESTLDEETYHTVRSEAVFSDLLDRMKEVERITFDLETSGLDAHQHEIIGYAIALEEEAYYIPTRHESDQGDSSPEQLDHRDVTGKLTPILEDPEIDVLGQNLKFDVKFLFQEEIELQGISCDTMLASYVLNPSRSSHSLKALAQKFLNHTMTEYDEITEDEASLRTAPVEEVSRYACEDVTATREVADTLLANLDEEGMMDLYRELEQPLIPILANMEWVGIRLDPEALEEMQDELTERLSDLEEQIWEEAGMEFNVNSPQQLQDVLFDHLDLEPVRKTKTGYSTDADTLEELADEHDVPEMILDYRSLAKLVNTYAKKLPGLVHEETGRLHTEFHQTRTSTGRLSSSEPNLQNIPVRTEEGRRIRRAFVADEDCQLLSADYSQVELRVLAHISGDRALTRAFKQGKDIHRATAADMFEVELDEVDTELREAAKTINFGIVYGISAYGLARRLDIDQDRAQEYIDRYLERYSGVKRYMDDIVEQAREDECVTTLMGRKRYIHEIHSDDYNTRSFAERTAINTPIQGSAADLIKKAMIRVDRALTENNLSARLVLQIHDELILEVPNQELMRVEPLLEGQMKNAMQLDVPLEVDLHSGSNWGEIK